MNWQKTIVWLSGALYMQSMVLPVLESTAGWEALRISMRSLVDFHDFAASLLDPFMLLLRASAISNIVFVVAVILLLRFPDRTFRSALPVLATATLLNGQWLVMMSKSSGLRSGYYAWLGAFLLLTVGAFARASAQRAAASRQVEHAKTSA